MRGRESHASDTAGSAALACSRVGTPAAVCSGDAGAGREDVPFDVKIGEWRLMGLNQSRWLSRDVRRQLAVPYHSLCWDSRALACVVLAVTCVSEGKEAGEGSGDGNCGGTGDGDIQQWLVIALEEAEEDVSEEGAPLEERNVEMLRYFRSASEEALLRLPALDYISSSHTRLPGFAQPLNASGRVESMDWMLFEREEDSALCLHWQHNPGDDDCIFDYTLRYTSLGSDPKASR